MAGGLYETALTYGWGRGGCPTCRCRGQSGIQKREKTQEGYQQPCHQSHCILLGRCGRVRPNGLLRESKSATGLSICRNNLILMTVTDLTTVVILSGSPWDRGIEDDNTIVRRSVGVRRGESCIAQQPRARESGSWIEYRRHKHAEQNISPDGVNVQVSRAALPESRFHCCLL